MSHYKASAGIRLFYQLVICLLVFALSGVAQEAATAPVTALNIVIIDGDTAVNNVKQRTAREAIVRVEDQNHKPVAGALVIFAAPEGGPGGSFVDGLRNFQVTTGPDGTARARFHPNSNTGQFLIQVNVLYQGLSSSTVIHQANVAGTGSGSGASTATTGGLHLSMKALLIVTSVVAAGAVAGTVLATRGGGGTTITAGTGSVSAPK